MTLTPDQERAYIADLERAGETSIRSDLDHGRISPALTDIVFKWLGDKEREREASKSAQIELMRRASDAAERQAIAAERANTRATIALAIAIVSMIVSIISIWVTHLDVHK